MPSYEIVCIARLGRKAAESIEFQKGIQEFVKPLARSAALQVLDNGGVVRGFKLLSQDQQTTLPYRMKRHQEVFDTGCVWSMHFDCSPETMTSLRRSFNFDERVIRHNIIRLGDGLTNLTRRIRPDSL
ncbi:hypothetical protein HDU97_001179 [Phlyctochytrium planicorne]|nr:hypothetical protein HDU97_001179 [Phlyctochytrium planicorne]